MPEKSKHAVCLFKISTSQRRGRDGEHLNADPNNGTLIRRTPRNWRSPNYSKHPGSYPGAAGASCPAREHAYCKGLNNYQHYFEAYLRFLIL